MARKAATSTPPNQAVSPAVPPGRAAATPTAAATGSNGGPRPLLEAVAEETQQRLVRPVVSTEEADAAWNEYLSLCKRILDERDYTYYVHGTKADGWDMKPQAFTSRSAAEQQIEKLGRLRYTNLEIRERKKRSAWDKLAQFFGLTLPKIDDGDLCRVEIAEVGPFIVERRVGNSFAVAIYQDKDSLAVVKASVTVAVTSPSGRTAIGDGVCSVNERRNGADSFAHADHDVPTTAYTRALNRAISRCIGTGEVSAEEFEADAGSTATAAAPVAPTTAVPTGEGFDRTTQIPAPPAKEPPESSTVAAPEPQPEPAKNEKAPAKQFTPLTEGTISQRLAHVDAFLFGPVTRDNTRRGQLVKYLFFAVPEPIDAEIERVEGRLDFDAWRGAMHGMGKEEIARRMTHIEGVLKTIGKEKFLLWAGQQVEKRFGKP
jgi:hypothetical protein